MNNNEEDNREEDQEEDVDDMETEEEEGLVCGLCGGPCDPHPDDPQNQDPICQPCRDKPTPKKQPTEASDTKTYYEHIRAWEQKRDTVLVESPTGYVFSVVKLSGMEIASIFEILGIDIAGTNDTDASIAYLKRKMELLDQFIQPNVRSPTLHKSDTPMDDIPNGEYRVDKLHTVDVDAIMTCFMEQATGGDIPHQAASFLGKPNVRDGRKARKKRGRNTAHGHN